MSRTFASFLGIGFMYLAACSLFVHSTTCASVIRMAVVTQTLVAIAMVFLYLASELPIGIWLALYRIGWFTSAVLTVFAVGRIMNVMQGRGCQL